MSSIICRKVTWKVHHVAHLLAQPLASHLWYGTRGCECRNSLFIIIMSTSNSGRNWQSMPRQCVIGKEIVERRHREPIKFLFLPKMGLLGSQASTEKKLVVNSEQLFRAVFSCFHGQKLNFFLHCRVRTKKLLNKKLIFFFLKFGKIFFLIKNWFF